MSGPASTPDIMAVAKGIGGGFPLGACLAKGEVAKSMVPGTHGSTYGGNPLACTIGNAVLDRILEPGFIEHVDLMGQRLAWHLQQLQQRFPQLCARTARQGPARRHQAAGRDRRCAISWRGCATTISC